MGACLQANPPPASCFGRGIRLQAGSYRGGTTVGGRADHNDFFSMVRRMSLIARLGFRPFGHTWVQFMMVWQR